MSRYAENLGRAARMLKRLDEIGGPSELEGVELKEIIDDVLTAQRLAYLDEAIGRVRVVPDDNVTELRRVYDGPSEDGIGICYRFEAIPDDNVTDIRSRIDEYSKHA